MATRPTATLDEVTEPAPLDLEDAEVEGTTEEAVPAAEAVADAFEPVGEELAIATWRSAGMVMFEAFETENWPFWTACGLAAIRVCMYLRIEGSAHVAKPKK
jgi:hypothetical protein